MVTDDRVRGISPHDLQQILNNTPGVVWLAQPPVVLYSGLPPGVAPINTPWFDFTNLKRALLVAISSLDQAVSVQLVGAGIADVTYTYITSMGTALSLPISGPLPTPPSTKDKGIGINDDWHPFLGAIITPAMAPASGLLTVTMYSQK